MLSRAGSVARAGWGTYRVAKEVAASYAEIAALVGAAKIGGMVTLMALALAPVGFVLALALAPTWPRVVAVPVILVLVAVAAAAFTLWTLFRALPRAARHVMDKATGARTQATGRRDALRALAERRTRRRA